jgi:DNA-binding transcriptional LysR family regulator
MLDIDTLKGQLEHASIDLESLLLLYQCYEELSRDATQNIAQVADKLGLNKHKLYRAVDKLQTAAGVGKVFDRRPGQGSRVLDEDRALFDRVKGVLEALQCLLRPDVPSLSPPVVRIGIPQVLAVRLFPPMLRHFRARCPDVALEIQVVPAHSDELIRMAPQGNLDMVLTFYDDARAQEDVAARARLRRCLLMPSGPALTFPAGPFSWKKLREWLAAHPGLTLAVLSHLAATLDLPWQELQTVRLTQVPTQIEAQGLVRAGLAIAFGLSELLSEDEERELRVVAVGEHDLTPVHVTLLRPQSARRRRTPTENDSIDLLQKALSVFLESELPRRRSLDPEALTRQLARFTRLWLADSSAGWLPGEVELTVTPNGCLRGSHRLDAEDGPRQFHVFGHLMAVAGGLHGLWRGRRPGEHYGAGVVWTAEALAKADHVVGTWSGARSGGPLVLHDGAVVAGKGRVQAWAEEARGRLST